jgi:hypothetical protein
LNPPAEHEYTTANPHRMPTGECASYYSFLKSEKSKTFELLPTSKLFLPILTFSLNLMELIRELMQ